MFWNNTLFASFYVSKHIQKPDFPDLQPNSRHVICSLPPFRHVKIGPKRKEQVTYFLERLVGDKVATIMFGEMAS